MIETKNAKSLAELTQQGNAVEHPDHYAGDGQIECMDAMRSMMSGEQYGMPTLSASLVGMRLQVPLALAAQERRAGLAEVQAVHRLPD